MMTSMSLIIIFLLRKEENNCEKNQTKKSLFSTYFFYMLHIILLRIYSKLPTTDRTSKKNNSQIHSWQFSTTKKSMKN